METSAIDVDGTTSHGNNDENEDEDDVDSSSIDDFTQIKINSITSNDSRNQKSSINILKSYVINPNQPISSVSASNSSLATPQSIEILNKNLSEPPPLAYYPKNSKSQKPIIFSSTQPPPLVPIVRNVI